MTMQGLGKKKKKKNQRLFFFLKQNKVHMCTGISTFITSDKLSHH